MASVALPSHFQHPFLCSSPVSFSPSIHPLDCDILSPIIESTPCIHDAKENLELSSYEERLVDAFCNGTLDDEAPAVIDEIISLVQGLSLSPPSRDSSDEERSCVAERSKSTRALRDITSVYYDGENTNGGVSSKQQGGKPSKKQEAGSRKQQAKSASDDESTLRSTRAASRRVHREGLQRRENVSPAPRFQQQRGASRGAARKQTALSVSSFR